MGFTPHRSLFAVLADAVENLPYLEPAVAIILGFVGVKIGLEFWGFQIANSVSLGVISGLLAAGIGLSKWLPPKADDEKASTPALAAA